MEARAGSHPQVPRAPAAQGAPGDDQAFLERWGYDADQKRAIAEAILAVAEDPI
jgi:hypothetical protein